MQIIFCITIFEFCIALHSSFVSVNFLLNYEGPCVMYKICIYSCKQNKMGVQRTCISVIMLSFEILEYYRNTIDSYMYYSKLKFSRKEMSVFPVQNKAVLEPQVSPTFAIVFENQLVI